MRGPLQFDGREIERWADTPNAAHELPRLVRRLLLASTKLRRLEIGAGSATRLGGWDGICDALAGTAFCPAGLSGWELSTEKGVKGKLDRDHDKRVAEPSPLDPGASYVAVTARRYSKKHNWVSARQRKADWSDVRLLDADDLAHWLEECPAVAAWFASTQLDRPTQGLTTLADALQRWSATTTPPLPIPLVLAGRDDRVEQIRQWLSLPRPPPLALRAPSRREAAIFAAAALDWLDEADQSDIAARALVVETPAAWRWLIQQVTEEPLILIPNFDEFDLMLGTGSHFVISPLDPQAPLPHIGALAITDPQPWQVFERELQALGLEGAYARRVAEQSGGRLQSLQSLLGLRDARPPTWVEREPSGLLVAMLLLGSWMPAHAGDREALARFGVDADELDHACARLLTCSEAPMIRKDGAWGWASPASAWRALAHLVTEADLAQFRDAAILILGEDDPQYELPANERFSAPMFGKSLRYSDPLRTGLAGTISSLPGIDGGFRERLGRALGSETARAIVRALLVPAWKRWASLGRLLPLFAEAAPSVVLDQLEASLQSAEGVLEMFVQEGSPGFAGATPHVGLLWALELLGWEPEHMSRVADLLARLAEADPPVEPGRPQKVGNRPLASLEAIFHVFTPQTLVEDAERFAVLEALVERRERIGFELLIGLLDAMRGRTILPQSYRPRHDVRVPLEPDLPTRALARSRAEQCLDSAIRMAGSKPEPWVTLIRFPINQTFGDERAQRVFDHLASVPAIQDPETKIWSAIRDQLYQLNQTSLHTTRPTRTEQLRRLYEHFTPQDLLHRISWIFEWRADWPLGPGESTHAQSTDFLNRKRDAALAEIFQREDAVALIERLCTRLTDLQELGGALARSERQQQFTSLLIESDPPSSLRALAVPFAAGVFRSRSRDLDWFETVLRRWTLALRHEDAYALALSLWGEPSLWDVIDTIGEPLRSNYWERVPRVGNHEPSQWERVVERLIDADNIRVALHVAGRHTKSLLTLTLLKVLEQWPPSAPIGQQEGFAIPAIFTEFDRRQANAELPAELIPAITLAELHFLGLFHSHAREPRFVSAELETNPKFFVTLLELFYLSDEGEKPEIPPERQRAAQNAYLILAAWRSFPGKHLGDPRLWEPVLDEWAHTVLVAARERGRLGGAQSELAKVLVRPSAAEDNYWPCQAARKLLETREYPKLRLSLMIAKRNMRGVTLRSPYAGGGQERDIATGYRQSADALRAAWPETAAMLYELAADYEREAADEDRRAREERWTDGVDLSVEAQRTSQTRVQEQAMESESPLTPITRLATLEVKSVGPFEDLELPLASRINVLAGDNSLGKTFVLDVAWWALTGSWPADRMAIPTAAQLAHEPAIRMLDEHDHLATSSLDRVNEVWPRREGWPIADAVVLYAHVDGGFTVWDRVRNGPAPALPVYQFGTDDLWRGLRSKTGEVLCRGLLADWRDWERDDDPRLFQALRAALDELKEPGVEFEPVSYVRLRRTGAVPIPTLKFPYGEVPLVHASAAWKRILALAYLLVWAWHEHRSEAQRQGVRPSNNLVLLVDEIEAHLHPRWQRVVLPALLAAAKTLDDATVQLIVTTHSPLAMASVEPYFDVEQDRVFHFDLDDAKVRVEEFPWAKRGDASSWLESPLFELRSATSPAAEAALQAAYDFIHGEQDKLPAGLDTADTIDAALRRSLAESHPFWLSWALFTGKGDAADASAESAP